MFSKYGIGATFVAPASTLLGELGGRREVVHAGFRIHQIERLRQVDLLQLVAPEAADICDLQNKLAGQLALQGEIDHMRIRRLHVVVEAVRDFKARPKRVVGRQRRVR